MGDDRYCFLHARIEVAGHALDEEDDKLGWDLPDDDIQVPMHLLPAYQDEDDETVLPSASHPSYPYGNPYNLRPLLSTTSSLYAAHPSSTINTPSISAARSGPNGSSGMLGLGTTMATAGPRTHAASLATNLPTLELRQLFDHTNLGDPRERRWLELGLHQLAPRGLLASSQYDRSGVIGSGYAADSAASGGGGAGGARAGGGAHGAGGAGGGGPLPPGVDAGIPSGQNAADVPSGDEEDQD